MHQSKFASTMKDLDVDCQQIFRRDTFARSRLCVVLGARAAFATYADPSRSPAAAAKHVLQFGCFQRRRRDAVGKNLQLHG